MNLLITGGAGFIGSAVVRQAVKQGHNVINLDKLTYCSNLENVACVADEPNYTFVQADICNRTQLDQIFHDYAPDAVMHLAAHTHVDRSIGAPENFIDSNINGTFHLLQAALAYVTSRNCKDSFRFHHVSTDEVFGSLDQHGTFDETTPYAPRSPYSASKAASDHLVRAWHETYGLACVISNCSNNYGPFQFPEKLIPVIILRALSRRPIPIYGTGANVRDWLYVTDHADALLKVLISGTAGRTYAIGGNSEMSNLNIGEEICNILDHLHPQFCPHSALLSFVADRPGHDFRYAIDASRIQTELGWRPKVTLSQGLKKTVHWYLENEAWWRPLISSAGTNSHGPNQNPTFLKTGGGLCF